MGMASPSCSPLMVADPQAGWSADKKAFCCENSNRGCEVRPELWAAVLLRSEKAFEPGHQCAGQEEQWDDCPDQQRCQGFRGEPWAGRTGEWCQERPPGVATDQRVGLMMVDELGHE
eukprot:Skav231601  [mRNA]  locus=scaffold232:404647:406422:+ [translate_table: standard]